MIIRKNNKHFLLLAAFLAVLTSCNTGTIYTDSVPLKAKKWELMNMLTFNVPVSDTINSNNIFFTIRTGSSYPFRNIFLFVRTTSPDGRSITDTLEYKLADEKGHWYGKGFGDIRELNLPYKTNIYFPLRGNYRFSIQHGMRVEDLEGIYDFGLRIEKTGK
jgi:gliding motility-associated lipoprotein GldH